MTLRIEIQEQPERNRFFAEVEIGGMVARRQLVTSDRTGNLMTDLDLHLAAVRAALREMVPGLGEARGKARVEEAGALTGSPTEEPALASLPPAPVVFEPGEDMFVTARGTSDMRPDEPPHVVRDEPAAWPGLSPSETNDAARAIRKRRGRPPGSKNRSGEE